ncbi:F-type H+-transporting ATPase subunit delta [Formivibrio citricus]|uniref:ATP synthase subunit delta n=1 Tax=Formivibrio citricus TaxID=83765 RepID=A0A1I5AIU8_9NEIS|nr:F0F1 ATP synthase subunit delta [Formivibrio citricus]SFN62280.1 F-type H+-transporting ATPase subunit delta [Formivibrio citricus]
MAELTTVARPYAEAVFRLAKESGSLDAWSESLAKLALIAGNKEAQAVVADPQFSVAQTKALLLELLGKDVMPEVSNFISTILENRRFLVLSSIATLFEELKAASEGQVDALIESAYALTDAQLADLTTTLSRQLNRKVNASVTVDSALIGGVKVTVGDLVVDASVRGKLSALAASLKN